VLRLLVRWENWPEVSGAKLLAGRYRVRIGDYRLQFFVEKIGHRDGFYED
jgi:mRNA-degrading endonuclease RelE of RelBE toxin-antitoxin system